MVLKFTNEYLVQLFSMDNVLAKKQLPFQNHNYLKIKLF